VNQNGQLDQADQERRALREEATRLEQAEQEQREQEDREHRKQEERAREEKRVARRERLRQRMQNVQNTCVSLRTGIQWCILILIALMLVGGAVYLIWLYLQRFRGIAYNPDGN
jgi:hypothetical protein